MEGEGHEGVVLAEWSGFLPGVWWGRGGVRVVGWGVEWFSSWGGGWRVVFLVEWSGFLLSCGRGYSSWLTGRKSSPRRPARKQQLLLSHPHAGFIISRMYVHVHLKKKWNLPLSSFTSFWQLFGSYLLMVRGLLFSCLLLLFCRYFGSRKRLGGGEWSCRQSYCRGLL